MEYGETTTLTNRVILDYNNTDTTFSSNKRNYDMIAIYPSRGGDRDESDKKITWQRICCGITYAITGILLGIMTFFPNLMLNDSGTNGGQIASYVGLAASLSFVLGGILAGIYNQCKWLLIGLILQISALVIVVVGIFCVLINFVNDMPSK